MVKRKLAAVANATQEITHEDNKLTISITNPRGTVKYNFTTDGKEFTYKDVDGCVMKAKATWDENKTKLTEDTNKIVNDKETRKITMIRYINKDGEMCLELINKDGIKTMRIFKKEEKK